MEAFVKELMLRVVNLLKKSQLIEVADYYELKVNSSKKKEKLSDCLLTISLMKR